MLWGWTRIRSYLTIIFSLHWLIVFLQEVVIKCELIYVPFIQDYFSILSLIYWFSFPVVIVLILVTKNKLTRFDIMGLVSWPFVIVTAYYVLGLKAKL